jgi:hypothetical protein
MKKAKILWFLPLLAILMSTSLMAEHSIGRAPLELYRGTNPPAFVDKADNMFFSRGEITFGIESANGWFASFDTDVPEVLTYIGDEETAGFSNAGDFGLDDQSIVYELDNASNFGYYNLANGEWTAMGTIAPNDAKTWSGMAVDPTDGTFYAITTDITSSDLYSIDPVSLTKTFIGNTGQAGLIALACDGNGDLWSYCIVADQFVSLNKATGASTVIGPLGFDANYGQGMTWDPVTGQVLMSAFNNTTFQPELREVDVTTGGSTLIGVIGVTDPGGLCQFGWIAIPGDYEPPVYCESTWNNATDDWITNVTFNTINNTTGQEGGPESYGDYTDISTNIEIGETYNFSMSWESGSYTEYGAVWIDWNHDLDFFDEGEEYQVGSGASATVDIDITVPATATPGPTRMRVSERWNAAPDPCNEANATYGETEDYTVNITGGPCEYCDASGGCDEFIDGILFGDINNQGTGCTEYGDYTDMSTEIAIGMTYDITITTGNFYTSDDYAVWIDWNMDCDFEDDGELVVCLPDAGAQTTIAPIEVPANAWPGETRMRVRLKWSGSDCGSPCGTTSYGEVEDYTVFVTGETPDPGIIDGTITLNEGPGNVEDVVVTVGPFTTNPNASGYYSFELLPGTYDIDVFLEGYYPESEDDVVVVSNETTTVDFTLIYIVAGALPLIEDFDDGIPTTWEIIDGSNDGFTWYGATSYNGNTLDGTPFAFVDSDAHSGSHLYEQLISPYADASSVGALLLEFDHYYNYLGTPEFAAVDVWDGSAWVNVATYMEDHGAFGSPEHVVLDIYPYANENLQVRFLYDDGNGWMWYWAVDNVHVYEPLFGTVEGTVEESGTGVPIEDAHVYFSGYHGYTDASGFYSISPVLVGTYTVNVESDYYLEDSQSGVVVTDGGTTVVDFELLWSEIAVDPDNFMVNVVQGQTSDEVMIITNDGPGELEYQISAMEDDTNRISLPAHNDGIKRGMYAPSLGAAPMDGVPVMNSDVPYVSFSREEMAYGIESANGWFVSMDVAAPEVLNYLGNEMTGGFSNAGTFGLGDQSFVYELDNANAFGMYDIETGAWTAIGSIATGSAQTWSGMTVDPTTGNFYGVSTDITASNLYMIDIENLTATLIGATGMPGLIDVAIDGTGTCYAYDLVTDEFVSLDLGTGAATVIGSLGYDANFGQGMAWDAANDILYLSAFNNTTFQPELRIADRATGNTTLVGVIGATDPGGLCQLGWMALPGAGVAWLSFDPNAGTVGPNGGQEVVVVTFDATDLLAGDIKTGFIHIGNNANYQRGDDYIIPVTMIVVPSGSSDDPEVPAAVTKLFGNYPNPFNPTTNINFSLKENEHVTIEVYNLKGEKVTTVINADVDAGNHTITWNGLDSNNKNVSSGVYFYKMKAGRYTSTKKMILMK